MNSLVRRLRGLLGVGLTWGALWATIGVGVGLVLGVVAPESWGGLDRIIDWAVGMGLYGVVSGVGFGSLLSLREGHRTVFDLPLRRVAIWGVLGAAAVPLFFGALGFFEAGTTTADVLSAILMTGFLGGAFAPISIAIARRAELRAVEETRSLTSEPASAPSDHRHEDVEGPAS